MSNPDSNASPNVVAAENHRDSRTAIIVSGLIIVVAVVSLLVFVLFRTQSADQAASDRANLAAAQISAQAANGAAAQAASQAAMDANAAQANANAAQANANAASRASTPPAAAPSAADSSAVSGVPPQN
jgi:hypothetical protein